MNNKIIFLHIPRTGGTTFRDILERFYHSENVIEIKKFIESEETIKTYTKDVNKIDEVIKFIKKEINNENQIFWVCPLIDESKKLDHQSSVARYNYIKKKNR